DRAPSPPRRRLRTENRAAPTQASRAIGLRRTRTTASPANARRSTSRLPHLRDPHRIARRRAHRQRRRRSPTALHAPRPRPPAARPPIPRLRPRRPPPPPPIRAARNQPGPRFGSPLSAEEQESRFSRQKDKPPERDRLGLHADPRTHSEPGSGRARRRYFEEG